MIRHLLILLCTLLAAPFAVQAGQAPRELGGIRLGTDITEYSHLEYTSFLKDVVISNWNGFAKGMISYGICKNPGMVVKIKFRYADSGEKFYKDILKQYKRKFGKPDKWDGDAFGIEHTWKWFFKDADNNQIELVLHHNMRNPEKPMGTVAVLSYPDRIQAERQCFNAARRSNMENMDHTNCGPGCSMRPADVKQYLLPR